MKIEYTNHHGVPVNITITEEFGGLMVTATYADDELQPEAPMIRDHSWTFDMSTLHVSLHHLGLQGFSYLPDGNDMLSLTGENDLERALISDSRMFCCNNQILMLPCDLEVK